MAQESREDSRTAADGTRDSRRWVSVGWSVEADAAQAARLAAEAAVTGPDPALLVAFCCARADPVAAADGLSAAAGHVPVVGCSSEAVMTPHGPAEEGVTVMALGGPGFSIATRMASTIGGRQREAGAEAAGCFREVADRRHRAMILLTDGYTRNQEAVLGGVYGVVGASFPLIGGSASPARTGGTRTFQLYEGKVVTDAVIAVALASDGPLGVGLRHGWRRVGDPLMVTHSSSGIVKTLNDEPALHVYLRRHGAPAEAYRDPAVFQAFARTRPLGVSRRAGDDVRDVSAFDFLAEGWLRSSGEIPEGGLVWLMEGDRQSVLDAAGEATDDAVAAVGGSPPLGLLAFDCVSRSGILGDEGTHREVERITKAGSPLIGMYTWGEIARLQGINAYHNLTLAILALG